MTFIKFNSLKNSKNEIFINNFQLPKKKSPKEYIMQQKLSYELNKIVLRESKSKIFFIKLTRKETGKCRMA